MEKRPFGRTGEQVPTLGLGTWNFEQGDRSTVIRAIHEALDLGMTHLDTAEMYGAGEVEELLGEALRGRRDRAFLASKVLPTNASYDGTIEACERSLRRLGTDHLDLYLLHWPSEFPLERTLEAFERLREDGRIRHWGVSNFDTPELQQAVELAGPGKVACNQVLYHLEERFIERELIPWCEEAGVAVVAYSPFGSGRFPSASSAGGRALREVADALGATPRQVALRFLTRRPSVFTIPKAGAPRHVQENAGAMQLVLSDEHVARLERAFPARRSGGLGFL